MGLCKERLPDPLPAQEVALSGALFPQSPPGRPQLRPKALLRGLQNPPLASEKYGCFTGFWLEKFQKGPLGPGYNARPTPDFLWNVL